MSGYNHDDYDYDDISVHHQLIKHMFEGGCTNKSIAKNINVSEYRLRNYMYAQGWFKDPVHVSEEQVKECLQKGYSNRKTANELGVSEGTIRNKRKKYGF